MLLTILFTIKLYSYIDIFQNQLHLNRNSYKKLGKNFVNFISYNYTSLPEINKKANIDTDVSSNSEIDHEMLNIRDDIPSKLLSMNKIIEGFFVEMNLHKKKKWLLNCSYNPMKMQISNHLAELNKGTDRHVTKCDQLLFLVDFNAEVEDLSVKNFCAGYNQYV